MNWFRNRICRKLLRWLFKINKWKTSRMSCEIWRWAWTVWWVAWLWHLMSSSVILCCKALRILRWFFFNLQHFIRCSRKKLYFLRFWKCEDRSSLRRYFYRKTVSRFNDKSIVNEKRSREYTRKNDCN